MPGGNNLRTLTTIAIALVFIGAAGCSETSTQTGAPGSTTSTTARPGAVIATAGDGHSVVSMFAGARWFGGTVPAKPTPTDPSATPIKIGVMSADSGAIAALPELHQGIDAAISWINAELGGVDGHPIVEVFCEVDISPEKSQLCARKMVDEHVVAVMSGVDLAAGDAIKILNENDIPWVGGIPIGDAEMQSVNTFQFSGGTPGAFVAFAQHAATTLKAKKVAIMYLNLAQVKGPAITYGIGLLKKLGIEVNEVGFDLTTQDYAAVAQKAAEGNPDAIIVGAADFACPKVMQAIIDLHSTATVYLVGSCADRKWLDQVGVDHAAGFVFNVESRIDQSVSNSADTELYRVVLAKYQPATTAAGAATVSFRGMMNLWSVLKQVGPAGTSRDVIAAFRASKDRVSFDGHPYTCDGKQIAGLPGLCAPQEVLIKVTADGTFSEASDGWIDVPAIAADHHL